MAESSKGKGKKAGVTAGVGVEVTRYHHFVPQFILRNFAHAYRPSKDKREEGGNKGKRGRKGKGKGNHLYLGEKVLNGILLTREGEADRGGGAEQGRDDKEEVEVEIIETKVARTFGIQDLYIDEGHATNRQHVEDLLSKLEAKAAEVIVKIRKTFDECMLRGIVGGEVMISRGEKDILRKFVFIQKYRGDNFRKRFLGKSKDDYIGRDKKAFGEYMERRGFKKPIEVWLDNIRAFIEIEMDAEKGWEKILFERAYPPDARWLIWSTSCYYLALCTPEHPEDEFLMTENGYGIHEGPVSNFVDEKGETVKSTYTEHHVFAHISPRLTMILRSRLLPLPVEDVDEEVKILRQMMNELTLLSHHNPETSGSFLHDLPVTLPRNSYSKVVGETMVPLVDGQETVYTKNDKFFFKFFPISTEHTNKINCVLLEEGYKTSIIAFNNRLAACRALEYYLSMGTEKGFKVVSDQSNDPRLDRLVYLKKLEKAVKLLGGNASAKYVIDGVDRVLHMVSQDTQACKLYEKLSQKKTLDPKDFEQARIMLKLRIKIDTWSRGLNEAFREKIRQNLGKMYCELPIHRLWIYLKRVRFMFGFGTILGTEGEIEDFNLPDRLLVGPEDLVAKFADLFLPTQRCRIMYHASTNHLQENNPEFGLTMEYTSDDDFIKRLHQEKALAFGPQGSICDCGIPHVQDLSRRIRASFRTEGFPTFGEMDRLFNMILSPEQMIELATRIETMNQLMRTLNPNSEEKSGEDLIGLLFDIVFPIFGSK